MDIEEGTADDPWVQQAWETISKLVDECNGKENDDDDLTKRPNKKRL